MKGGGGVEGGLEAEEELERNVGSALCVFLIVCVCLLPQCLSSQKKSYIMASLHALLCESESNEEDECTVHSEEVEVEEEKAVHPTTKVRDHDHRLEKFNFRGAAHAGCNLQFQSGWRDGKPTRSWKVPILFHNFKFYDSHILIRSLRDSPSLN